jgi:hypothetical protein
MLKKATLSGLIVAIVYVLYSILIVSTDISKRTDLFILPLVLNLVVIGLPVYFCLLWIRKTAYNNEINYGQTFYSGVIMSITGGIFLFSILVLLEKLNIFIPDLLETLKVAAIENMKIEKISQDKIDQYVNVELTKPYIVAQSSLIQFIFKSIVITTIISLFVRNKDTFTSQN